MRNVYKFLCRYFKNYPSRTRPTDLEWTIEGSLLMVFC